MSYVLVSLDKARDEGMYVSKPYLFNNDAAERMDDKENWPCRWMCPPKFVGKVSSVSKDAIPIHYSDRLTLCNRRIVAKHQNPRLWASRWEKVCRPKDRWGRIIE